MKVNRKFLRSAERLSLSAIAKDSAAQKIVSAVTAIGFVMQPVAALASTITRTDGGPNVSFNNGVADVFAGKVVGDVAINQFKEFQLDANNIANMYFGKDKDGNEQSPKWICSPLSVVAMTRDNASGEWGRLLRWQDSDGVAHQCTPRAPA